MGPFLHILNNYLINIEIRFRTHSATTDSRLDFNLQAEQQKGEQKALRFS